MQCHEAENYVSVLYDGEAVPADAAEHIRGCSACRARLRDYAEIAVELRLFANRAAGQTVPALEEFSVKGRQGFSWWRRVMTARVWVPRYAVMVAVALILGLSAGFGWVQAQPRGPWFQFDLSSADGVGAKGNGVLPAGSMSPVTLVLGHPAGSLAAMFELLEVRSGGVRLAVRTRRMAGDEMAPASLELLTPHEYWYYPGQTLTIPVEGGGQLLLTGELLAEKPTQPHWEGPLNPNPDQISITNAMLVRDRDVVFDSEGASASAKGDRAAVAVYESAAGLFVWALQPFEGAVEGEAHRAQARFTFEGKQYVLSSATPITGGDQPRAIWFYHDPGYKPSRMSGGFVTASRDVSELLNRLKK